MKILLDPVYTSKPSTCSTSYLMWKIIEGLSLDRDDVFFYLRYPSKYGSDDSEMEFLSRMPDRVILLPRDYTTGDRVGDLFNFPGDLKDDLMTHLFNPGWDADAVITSRIPQLHNFVPNSHRDCMGAVGGTRMVVGLDEMPIYSFRNTVAYTSTAMDIVTMANYLVSTAVVVNNLWTKDKILHQAKSLLSPASVKRLRDKIKEATPVPITRISPNPRQGESKELCVCFCGRTSAVRNFDEVLDTFAKSYIYTVGAKSREVKYIVSTHSIGTVAHHSEFVEYQYNTREQFHAMLMGKAHLAINLSEVEDFSLSTWEPLSFGVPVIVLNRPWSQFLGDKYPFRVSSTTEAYAIISAFADDYEGMYNKFMEWESNHWKSIIELGTAQTTTNQVIEALDEGWSARVTKYYSASNKSGYGGAYRSAAMDITKSDLKVVNYCDVARDMGIFPKGISKTTVMSRVPCFLVFKHLLNSLGWRDVQEPGVLIR